MKTIYLNRVEIIKTLSDRVTEMDQRIADWHKVEAADEETRAIVAQWITTLTEARVRLVQRLQRYTHH